MFLGRVAGNKACLSLSSTSIKRTHLTLSTLIIAREFSKKLRFIVWGLRTLGANLSLKEGAPLKTTRGLIGKMVFSILSLPRICQYV